MRRKDREMSEEFALDVLDQAEFGVLSLCHEGRVLSRPLSFARDNKTLYFHSATSGEKVDSMEEGAEVQVVFATDVYVPELYDEEQLQDLIKEEGVHVLLSKVFTTQYSSAMVQGVLRRAQGEEKILGLRRICEKYTPSKMAYFQDALEQSLDHVLVYGVEMKNITGKRKKFDVHGEEMKWQRKD